MDYFEEGHKLYDEKKYDEAIQIFKKVQSSDIDYLIVQYNIGVCYIKKAEIEKNIDNYNRFLKKSLLYFLSVLKRQNHYETLFNISCVYLLLNNIPKAYIYANMANSINNCEKSKMLIDKLTTLIKNIILE